jgi:hypothetical protein
MGILMRKSRKKTKALIQAEKSMDIFLKRVGYSGKGPRESIHEIPDYSTDNYRKTSNSIPDNGSSKMRNTYTGDELMGISQLHKSNAVPIRKDNKQAAVESAQMRRN